MKKITLLVAVLFITSTSVNAQNLDLQTPVNNLKDQIEGVFPLVAGILFLIVVLVNLGHFIKEGGDWKKGLWNIFLFVVVLGVAVGLYTWVTSIAL